MNIPLMSSLFGAGFLTSLTPCVYPMIPLTLGFLGLGKDQQGVKLKVIGFTIGQVLTFTFLGMMAVTLGEIVGFSSEIPQVKIATGVIILVLAFFSLYGEMPAFLTKWNNKVNQTPFEIKDKSLSHSPLKNSLTKFFSGLVIGAVSSLVASPCTSPVLAGVLTTVATSGSLLTGSLLMFFYSLGFSLIFLLSGLGINKLQKLPRSGAWLKKVHTLSSVLLVLAGLYFLYDGIRFLI